MDTPEKLYEFTATIMLSDYGEGTAPKDLLEEFMIDNDVSEFFELVKTHQPTT